MRMTAKDKQIKRQREASQRQEKWAAMTAEQKLKDLNNRKVRAEKQRKKLQKELPDEPNEKIWPRQIGFKQL